MRIFSVFIFSLFLFGCGADKKHPESLSEIIKYQAGNKITDKEIEEIGFSKKSRDMIDNIEIFSYESRDVNSINANFWLENLAVFNDKIQASLFKFNLIGTEEVVGKHLDELRAYIKEEFDAELELMDTLDAENVYFADIGDSKGVGKIVLSINETVLEDKEGIDVFLLYGSVGFFTEEIALKIGF